VNVKNAVAEKGTGDLSVELDTEITPELKREGLKRELVRSINDLRKQSGLTIKDRITVTWQSEAGDVREVFDAMSEDIKKDTLSDDIISSNLDESVQAIKINDHSVKIAVRKK
jgi:isoleucyl-tRNA synthetase